jgi:hypothetical protein
MIRWIAFALALAPVLLVPACYGTRAVLIARERKPVHGMPAEEYPVVVIHGTTGRRTVEIAATAKELQRILADDPAATLRAPANEIATIRDLVSHVRSVSTMPDPEEFFHASADFQDAGRTQKVHVSYDRAIAMGDGRCESWYETDGRALTPRYERRFPSGAVFFESMLFAFPIALVASGFIARIAAARSRSRSQSPANEDRR